MALSALTIGSNIGTAGARFATAISGGSVGGVIRVVSGDARTGYDGLVFDILPYGVGNVVLRETGTDGASRDTSLTIYGVNSIDERSATLAALAKGQTDTQQRAAIAAAPNTFAGLQAVGLGLVEVSGGTPAPTPTPTPTPTPALPENIAWRANAFSTTAADGASIPVPVVTGGTALAPVYGSAKFVANAVNGLKGIRFDGNAVHEIPRASNAAYYVGQEAQNWTMHILFTNAAVADPMNVLVQFNDAQDLVRLSRSTGREDTIGVRRSSISLTAHSVDAGTHVLSIRSSTANVTAGVGQTSSGNTLVAIDGLPVAMFGGAIPKPGDGAGGSMGYLGAIKGGYAVYGCIVTLVDQVVYNEAHTLGQIWDAAKALRYSAGLGMASKILMVTGSSLKQGSTADATAFAAACEIIRQCGLPFGSVGTFALGGIDFAGMSQMGPELDGLLSRLGAANCYLLAGEGYNSLLGSNTAAQAAASFVSYLTARKDAGWLPANMFLDTITGVSSARPAYEKYPDYATAVKAIPASNPALSAVRVINTAGVYSDNATEIRVGFDGSNNPLNIHLSDGVHMTGKPNYPTTDSGYPYQVDKVFKAPVLALGLGA